MLWQVDRLRYAFRDGASWENFVREFPDVVCAPGSFEPQVRRELMDLFSRYVDEWQNAELADAVEGMLRTG